MFPAWLTGTSAVPGAVSGALMTISSRLMTAPGDVMTISRCVTVTSAFSERVERVVVTKGACRLPVAGVAVAGGRI